MRPRHWVKNVLVAAAPLFALVSSLGAWGRVLGAFVAFSMTASAFYLINDVRDRAVDRQHPLKQHRPIAAGRLSVRAALLAAGTLLVLAFVISVPVAPWLAAALGGYALLQTAYNLGLKQQPILDLMVIAGGFVLRAVGGAAAAGVPASGWFILCVGLLALFLGIEKRRAELRDTTTDATARSVMQTYSLPWLRRMEAVVTASALMAYALWTLEGAETPWMLATVPFVAYAIFRYQYLSEQGKGDTPVDLLLRDPGMVAVVVLWALSSLFLLLLAPPG